MIVPNCMSCKNWKVDPLEEPCKTCLKNGREKGIVASGFEQKENEE